MDDTLTSHDPFPMLRSTRFEHWSEEHCQNLLETIDESDYSIQDWDEAYGAFDRWLTEQGESRRPYREMIGYMHCCTYTATPGLPLAKLEVVVTQALIEYGFAYMTDPQI